MTDCVLGGSAQTVAVDLGGTNVRAALVDADGTLVDQIKEPVRGGSATTQIVELMTRVARSGRPSSAVVGVPGRIDREKGRVLRARNLPSTVMDQLSAAYLTERTGLPVEFAGDAELAAVGESYFGAGTTVGQSAYLTFSTGVGAAALADGIVVSGRVAGLQIGLARVLGPDRPIADLLASGRRIQSLSRSIGRPVDYRGARDLSSGGSEFATAAQEALDDIHSAAVAVAIIVCHVCSADVIVVGGGLAHATDGFLATEIDRRIKDREFSNVSWSVAIREAARGDDSGLVGAAAWRPARPRTEHAAGPAPAKTSL